MACGGPPADHGFHPPTPGQEYYVQFRGEVRGVPSVTEAVVQMPSPAAAAELDQAVEVPASAAPVRLKRYLPQARLEQDVLPAEEGPGAPAVELAITGPAQSFRRWLIAGDPDRNRLVSFIGTWRYMVVEKRE
ncbi:MAG: hypothetical protein V2A79_10435 [Planctomycetota bacterium]